MARRESYHFNILATRTASNDTPAAAQIDAQLPLEQDSKEANGEQRAVLHSKDGGQKVYQASWTSQARPIVEQTGSAVYVGC